MFTCSMIDPITQNEIPQKRLIQLDKYNGFHADSLLTWFSSQMRKGKSPMHPKTNRKMKTQEIDKTIQKASNIVKWTYLFKNLSTDLCEIEKQYRKKPTFSDKDLFKYFKKFGMTRYGDKRRFKLSEKDALDFSVFVALYKKRII